MRRGRSLAVVAIAVLVVVGSWGCGGTGGTPPSGKGNLQFEDDGASWVTTDNYFATVTKPTTPTWFGILYQFGRFTDNPFTGKVQFLDGGGNPVGVSPLVDGWLDQTQFTWINIVASRPGVGDPLEPNQVLGLFPNSLPNDCDKSNASGSLIPDCLRDRRIHYDQAAISFIITYWQGDKGYKLDSKPAEDHADRNVVDFKFQDDFSVTVYKLDDAAHTMQSVMHLDAGTVKTIKIENTDSGSPHGGKHDPPWIQ